MSIEITDFLAIQGIFEHIQWENECLGICYPSFWIVLGFRNIMMSAVLGIEGATSGFVGQYLGKFVENQPLKGYLCKFLVLIV